MVSNDDIDFSTRQVNLKPIETDSTYQTMHQVELTVPTGKRWRVVAVSMEQAVSDTAGVSLVDLASNDILLVYETVARLFYQPKVNIWIPAGWRVRATYGSGSLRWMYTEVLIEEEILYET